MLSVAMRQLARSARSSRDLSAPRIVSRAFASTAVGKTNPAGDMERFEPSQWFQDFMDPQVRAQLNKLREIENDLLSAVSPKSAPVDWTQWESDIKFPGLVKELKAIHESTPIPDAKAEEAKLAQKLNDVFNPIMAEFEQLAKESEAETAELEKRADEVSFLRDNLNNLTVDEFLEKYPTVKASIEDDIAKNRWFVSE